MRLFLGTSNAGKITEIREALQNFPYDIISPLDLGIRESPQEEGKTFEENARQKALFYYEKTNLPTLADDSGIIVEALENELGIHTRRWGAGADATDQEWVAYFLNRMNKESNKKAHFTCCLCFMNEHGQEYIFEGFCDGTITDVLEADYLPGLPISACFKAEGYDKVYSALSIEEKNMISHRGKAMQKFMQFLEGR